MLELLYDIRYEAIGFIIMGLALEWGRRKANK